MFTRHMLHSSDFLQRSRMIEAQMGRLGPIFFCEANFQLKWGSRFIKGPNSCHLHDDLILTYK